MVTFLAKNIPRNNLFCHIKRIFAQSTRTTYRRTATVSKDATLYYHDRRRFFRLVGLASGSQCLLWIYFAHFQYTTRQKLAGIAERKKQMNLERSESKVWKIVQYIEQSPVFLSVFAVSAGMFLSATGWIYCLRSINRIVLLKGGGTVKFVTHTPLGGTRSLTAPVNDVSSLASRRDNKTQIPVKVKGYKFFFIVDKEGKFLQPSLFDSVVCMNRYL